MNNDKTYKRAKRKVEAVLGFYFHLAVYLTINGLIFLGDPGAFPGDFWFFWPWSICLFLHVMGVLKPGSGIKKRMIEKEMRKQPGDASR